MFCSFQDEGVISFKDEVCFVAISKNPINKYHLMVIPNHHYENFVDLPDEIAAHIFLVAKKASAAMRKVCNPVAIHHMSDDDINDKGFNLVKHYKFHIIPRFENDGIKIEWTRENLNLEERAAIAQEIKKAFI